MKISPFSVWIKSLAHHCSLSAVHPVGCLSWSGPGLHACCWCDPPATPQSHCISWCQVCLCRSRFWNSWASCSGALFCLQGHSWAGGICAWGPPAEFDLKTSSQRIIYGSFFSPNFPFHNQLWNLHSSLWYGFFVFSKMAKFPSQEITPEASSGLDTHLASMTLEDKLRKICENVEWQTERGIFWCQKIGK